MGYFYTGGQGDLLLPGCIWTHRGVDTPTHYWKKVQPIDLWMKVMEEKDTVTLTKSGRQTGNPRSVFERSIWSRSSFRILKRFLPVRLKKFKPTPPLFCPLTVCTLRWSSKGWGRGKRRDNPTERQNCAVTCRVNGVWWHLWLHVLLRSWKGIGKFRCVRLVNWQQAATIKTRMWVGGVEPASSIIFWLFQRIKCMISSFNTPC